MPVAKSIKTKIKQRDLFELLTGYSCNANCRFCSIDPANRGWDSDTYELRASILQAKEDGCKYLGIGGGEPTIRSDLLDLIRLGKQLKFEVVRIETNGIALSYFNYCKRLVEAGLDFVKLSVHGHNAEIHDFLTRVPGSFQKVVSAIDNLQKLKVRIEINTVLNKVNYRHYEQFVDFFSKRGIGSFCFIYPLYTGRMAENWRKLGIGIQEVAPYLKRTLKLVDALELDKRLVFNIPKCFMEDYKKGIVEEYNMRLASPDAVVLDPDNEIKRSKIKLRICRGCVDNQSCDGIWKEYYKIYGKKDFKNKKR